MQMKDDALFRCSGLQDQLVFFAYLWSVSLFSAAHWINFGIQIVTYTRQVNFV